MIRWGLVVRRNSRVGEEQQRVCCLKGDWRGWR